MSFYYDGGFHQTASKEDDGYTIDVINCDEATPSWDKKKWAITLTNIKGKTKCILNFKKDIPEHKLTINPSGGTYEGTTEIKEVSVKEGTEEELEEPTRDGYIFIG